MPCCGKKMFNIVSGWDRKHRHIGDSNVTFHSFMNGVIEVICFFQKLLFLIDLFHSLSSLNYLVDLLGKNIRKKIKSNWIEFRLNHATCTALLFVYLFAFRMTDSSILWKRLIFHAFGRKEAEIGLLKWNNLKMNTKSREKYDEGGRKINRGRDRGLRDQSSAGLCRTRSNRVHGN